MRSHPTEKLDYIKILTYYNLYLYSYFFISLPSKFLTKPLRVLEDKVNKTNKQLVELALVDSLKNHILKHIKSLALACVINQKNQVLVKRFINIKFLLHKQSVKLGVWF